MSRKDDHPISSGLDLVVVAGLNKSIKEQPVRLSVRSSSGKPYRAQGSHYTDMEPVPHEERRVIRAARVGEQTGWT
jgi:hypothetical protein